MKKLFYIIALVVVASVALNSCTEEVIKPKGSGNGTVGMPIKEI